MKFSIEKGELQRGLVRIQSIVERRNTMPILANVLLTATRAKKSSKIELAATDLEVGVRSAHDAEVDTAGSVTVSAKKFYEIVRELPEEPVHIEVSDEAYLDLRCARAHFHLAGASAEEYPALPSFAPEKLVPLPPVVLSQMIERTLYAASSDETRYNLNGVHLELLEDGGKLRMVATDGHRLAYVDRDFGEGITGLGAGVIIPRKGLTELKRLLDEEDAEEVELGFEGNSALARRGRVTLVMRLIEGEFPNYHQVIPKEITQRLVVQAEVLARVLRRVALLSADRGHAVKLELEAGTLRLSSNNPDLGDAREELDVDYDGERLEIAFNAQYLMEALNACRAKEMEIAFADTLSPARLTPTDDPGSLAVVMPMRL